MIKFADYEHEDEDDDEVKRRDVAQSRTRPRAPPRPR
jgi:hypothetical protein